MSNQRDSNQANGPHWADGEQLGHAQYQVGLAETPLGVGTERDRHGVVGIAQPGAVLRPGCEERDLVVAETARIAERAEAGTARHGGISRSPVNRTRNGILCGFPGQAQWPVPTRRIGVGTI